MNEAPDQQQPEEQPPSTPEQPTPPTPTPDPVTPTPTPTPVVAEPVAMAQKKSKKLPIIIGSAIAALLVIAAVLFFILFYPRLHAESLASSFMSAIKTNDDAKMKQLSGSGSDSVTQRIHDNIGSATYKISSTDQEKNGGFDVHFAVTGSSVIDTVTIVVEKDQITNVVSTSKTTAADTTTPTTKTTTPVATTPTTCLSVADLDSIGITGFDPLTTSEQTLYSFYFQPDSSSYDNSTNPNDISYPAGVYTKFSNKAFTYSLRGQVNQATSTSGGVQIAQERTAKVQSDLIAAGVPANRISIDDPVYSTDNSEPTIFRTVTLFISCKL